jgi:hypothetical protein
MYAILTKVTRLRRVVSSHARDLIYRPRRNWARKSLHYTRFLREYNLYKYKVLTNYKKRKISLKLNPDHCGKSARVYLVP